MTSSLSTKTTLNRKDIFEFMESADPDAKKIFGVTFIKKDGSIRHMAARRGVRKGVKDVLPKGHRKAEDRRNHVLTVFDTNVKTDDGRGAFRRINVDTILALRVTGDEWRYDETTDQLVKQ